MLSYLTVKGGILSQITRQRQNIKLPVKPPTQIKNNTTDDEIGPIIQNNLSNLVQLKSEKGIKDKGVGRCF